MDLTIVIIILLSGWIPPALCIVIAYRMAKRSQINAEAMRDDAVKVAKEWHKELQLETRSLRDFTKKEISQTKEDLLVKMKTLEWTDDREKELKKSLRKTLINCINGKEGSEIKNAKAEIVNDPEIKALIEDAKAFAEPESFAERMRDKIMVKILDSADSWF